MLYAKVISVVFVVFTSMNLFDFYLYMLAMYGLCLQIYHAEYILNYICYCILLIFGYVKG